MTRTAYTYAVLRYSHDPTSGESLNIGVLLYAPTASYLDVMFEKTYSRLSAAFADFDGKIYRRVIDEFARGVARIRDLITQPNLIETRPRDAASVAAQLWPDSGLSFRFGHSLGGVTADLPSATRQVFERFVSSQFVKYDYKRRADEDVWHAIESTFKRRALDYLRPRSIQTRYGPQVFQRTFRNERLYVIEPISLDYADAQSIVDTATIWRGRLDVIHDNSDEPDSAFHLIVGSPKPEHAKAAKRALQMIRDARLESHIYREDIEAPSFAKEISDYILKHTTPRLIESESDSDS